MCFAGTVVAFWFFTQEVAGSNPFTVMRNIFVTEFSDFSEALRENFTVHKIRCLQRIQKWRYVSVVFLGVDFSV